MTDQEAFEAWWESASGRITLDKVWHAALAYLRSQQEPVGHVEVEEIPYCSPRQWRHVVYVSESVQEGTPVYDAPQPAIPDGWKLVPVEPTTEMLEAGEIIATTIYNDFGGNEHVEIGANSAEAAYHAMLTAAPEYKK